ncbi:hypothetical protein BJX66DRAFT_299057 [Aspergillus keveii]|uniref:DUF7730 domain-containing protein n=1 Tax=Aspergillus keveii TaxID=714993 RepID=A0ABR4GCC8_9EURO
MRMVAKLSQVSSDGKSLPCPFFDEQRLGTNTITQHQYNTPPFRFLALPAEIRQMIYRFALGEQNIRARHFEDYRLSKYVPDESLSFRFRKDDIAKHLQELYCFERSVKPQHSHLQAAKARIYGWDTVSLNLLLASRQVYNEAWKIPYSTNTFAFAEAHVFRLFISAGLSHVQTKRV